MSAEPESIQDTLRRWATAFTENRLAFSHSAETHNADEFRELCGLLAKSQAWLREKGLPGILKGKAGGWTALTVAGFRFKVTYAPKKRTATAETSRAAFHNNAAAIGTQRHQAALFLLERTAAGDAVNIRGLRDYFRALGSPLGENNTASRAMNELKRLGIEIDGTEYRMSEPIEKKDPATGETTGHFFLLPTTAREDGAQTTLF